MTRGRGAAGSLPRAVPRVAPASAPGRAPVGDEGDVPPGCLLRWLSSDAFPAERELLVAAAQDGGAPCWLVDALGRLPLGQVFQNVEQLAAALHTQRQVRVAAEREVVRARARP